MEPVFQPSFEPYLSTCPDFDRTTFQHKLIEYLEAYRGKYPEITRDFAIPDSPLFVHLIKAYFKDRGGFKGHEMERKSFFLHHILSVVRLAMKAGHLEAAEKLCAPNLGGETLSSKNKKPDPPLPAQTTAPVRPVSPPPRRVVSSSSGVERAEQNYPVDRSANSLYISKLKKGVNTNLNKLSETLLEMGFPAHLVEADNLRLRPLREDTSDGKKRPPSCFLQGPDTNPQWAQQMVDAKWKSGIRYTDVHLDKAHPPKPKQGSPDRAKKVEEMAAALQRISLGEESPMHSSPSPPKAASPFPRNVPTEGTEEDDSEGRGLELKGDGSNTRKRMLVERVEGRQSLFQASANIDMDIGSPAPVRAKVANMGQTPQVYRIKDGMQKDDMQMGTPAPKSRDAPMEGEEGEMVKSNGEEISFDDALSPPSSATKTEKSTQQKEEEEEVESSY
jgi:hypothetical protein